MPIRTTLMAATALAAPALAAVCWVGAARAQPVTGLYIGGAGGANFLQDQRVTGTRLGGVPVAPAAGKTRFDAGVVGLGSVGYGFGNGLRVELEGDYRYNRFDPRRVPGDISSGGREQKYGAMVNALFDLDVRSPYVFPYIGAGVGYQWVAQRFERVRVTPGTGTTVEDGGGTDSSFAYQGIAGLSFPIPPVVGLSLTAEYRFMGLTGDRRFGGSFTRVGVGSTALRTTAEDDYNHSLLLGLRYAFYVPRPPPRADAAPEPVAAPAPAPARSYLVFFDWDRADLSDRARQIIAEAAQATTRVQVTRIEVAGHTDASGTPQYNQGLSRRRAQAVASELVRQGVPREAITVQAFGESRPLVPTGDGVREPQNRRVEIVLR